MGKFIVPPGYRMPLTIQELQRAIDLIHTMLQDCLSSELNLHHVFAPLFMNADESMNTCSANPWNSVSFDLADVGTHAGLIWSLSRWNRLSLKEKKYEVGEGLFTNSLCVRRSIETDNLNSIYVRLLEWEKLICDSNKTIIYLKDVVRKVVSCICEVAATVRKNFPALSYFPDRDVYFITVQELDDRFPNLTISEQKAKICRSHHTVFLMGKERDVVQSSEYVPDCKDSNLSGQILMWNPVLHDSIEISSMGIRANTTSLKTQFPEYGCVSSYQDTYYQKMLDDNCPDSIGGSIGKDRLCMLLLSACHIGEVHVGLWDECTVKESISHGILLL